MIVARRVVALFVLAAAAASAGCGKGDQSKLVTVQGTVTVGGKTLPRGTVVFTPNAEKGNTSLEEPRGEINAEGNFTISTRHNLPGVAPGWYLVKVSAGDVLDPKNPYFTKLLHPDRYQDTKTSGLAFEVVENPPPGYYDLKLESK